MIVVGLHLRVSNGQTSFDRRFLRPPVIIGRDTRAAHCIIQDLQVSKLHACIDVQDGAIRVRDAGSTNGTYVDGRRLTPNCWVRLGAAGEAVELRIGEYTIRASIHKEETTLSLAELAEEIPGHRAPRRSKASVPSPSTRDHASGTFEMHSSVLRLTPAYASARSGMTAFYDALAKELEAAPSAARPHVCDDLVRVCESLAEDVQARAIMERSGWRAPSDAPLATASLGGAAIAAMQELAKWYVGGDRALTTPAEVAAFTNNVRATLDELLLGYRALIDGMSRFEQHIDIPSEPASPLPSSPVQLAAALLDWASNNDTLRQRLRGSFAELMMHQVALLNGLMSGVKALLSELSPARIEKAAAGHPHGLFRRSDPWTVYKRRHSDLADEENERFRLLFGPEFVEEYRQFTRETTIEEKP